MDSQCCIKESLVVDCDREAWVLARILTAQRAALAVSRECQVPADESIQASGLLGIANGAAVEIIRTLGLTPGFVNLRRPPNEPA